jgi:hypothetical protein
VPFKIFLGLLIFCCLMHACSPYRALRTRRFSFNENGTTETLKLKVPKRYAKSETGVDSAGNQQLLFHYANGATLYFIRTNDTLAQFYPIDTARHIPKLHPLGGKMYKGIDSAHTHFWREIKTNAFHFGYRHVSFAQEALFDSSLNFAAARRFKKKSFKS